MRARNPTAQFISVGHDSWKNIPFSLTSRSKRAHHLLPLLLCHFASSDLMTYCQEVFKSKIKRIDATRGREDRYRAGRTMCYPIVSSLGVGLILAIWFQNIFCGSAKEYCHRDISEKSHPVKSRLIQSWVWHFRDTCRGAGIPMIWWSIISDRGANRERLARGHHEMKDKEPD